MAKSQATTRRVLTEAVLVACFVLGVYALSRPPAVATLGRLYDDVVYLSVGKSIADGLGYRSAQLVGAPVHVKFPPLLPAIYAAAWGAFGSLDSVARVALWLNIVVTSICSAALWWLARRELHIGRVLSALFVMVPILTDRTMFYFSGATSEPWMLLGWSVALILVRRLSTLQLERRVGVGTAVALGLVLAATSLARTQGLAVAVAILAAGAGSRVNWRVLAVATVATSVPLLAWGAWHRALIARGPLSTLPDQSGYTAWIPTGSVGEFASFAVTMTRTSLPLYWNDTADLLTGWTSPKTLVLATALLLCGIIGLALVALVFPALTASVLAVLAVLAIWPYVQDRFLTPVLPVLGLAGAYGVQRAIDRLPFVARRLALSGAALVACALLALNMRTRIASARGVERSPFAHAVADIVDWVRQNTTADERIMVPWGGAIYLHTGRRTTIPNPEEPALGARPETLRLYAARLLADSVDDLVIWDRAPGRSAVWLRQLGATCAGTLTVATTRAVNGSGSADLHFYRVHRDNPCLARTAADSADRR